MLAIYARFQTETDFDFLEKSNFGICVLEFFNLDPKVFDFFKISLEFFCLKNFVAKADGVYLQSYTYTECCKKYGAGL